MSVKCRWTLAVALTLLATQSPALAWELTPGSPPPSPKDCVRIYVGGSNGSSGLVDYQAGSQITCRWPGNNSPYGPAAARTVPGDAVPDGAPCQVLYYAPVKFQDFPSRIRMTWQSPSGGSGGAADLDPGTYAQILHAAPEVGAVNDVFWVYARQGTYQNQQCQFVGPWQDLCQDIQLPDPNVPCILTQPHRITPAESPPPPAGPYVAKVIGDLKAKAGTVGSLPSPNGLVNLPTCFWIDDIAVPDERDFTMVLPGPPDGTNRRIYYTYLVRVFFAGVDWSFDDPFGNEQVRPHPACGQHPQMTAHSYQMISEKHSADGYYHVSATEKYQVTVDLYWDDSYGAHHQAVDPGVALPITVSPQGPYRQYVGQVEGIPIGA
jgi:hypothetical protein